MNGDTYSSRGQYSQCTPTVSCHMEWSSNRYGRRLWPLQGLLRECFMAVMLPSLHTNVGPISATSDESAETEEIEETEDVRDPPTTALEVPDANMK